LAAISRGRRCDRDPRRALQRSPRRRPGESSAPASERATWDQPDRRPGSRKATAAAVECGIDYLLVPQFPFCSLGWIVLCGPPPSWRGRRSGHRPSSGRGRRISARYGRRTKLAPVFLAAPTSPEKRLRDVAKHSRGFVYAISRTHYRCAAKSLRVTRPLVSRTAESFTPSCRSPSALEFRLPNNSPRSGFRRRGCGGSAIVQRIEQNPGQEAAAVSDSCLS